MSFMFSTNWPLKGREETFLLPLKGKWSSLLCLVKVLGRKHSLFSIPHIWSSSLDQKYDYRDWDKDHSSWLAFPLVFSRTCMLTTKHSLFETQGSAISVSLSPVLHALLGFKFFLCVCSYFCYFPLLDKFTDNDDRRKGKDRTTHSSFPLQFFFTQYAEDCW